MGVAAFGLLKNNNKNMNKEERENLKKKAIKRDDLANLSKYKRVIKDPKIFFQFFIFWFIGKYIKPVKIKHKTLWGDKMTFYVPEGQILVSKGFFEINLFNFMLNFVKEGDFVMDIGAHVGSYTKLLSKLVGDSGKVYAFEPTPRTFKTLWNNTRYDKNVITNNFALLNEKKEIFFEDYGPGYSYFNGFKKREAKEISSLKSKEIKVEAITLDSYFFKNKIDRCNFIKIDAEGAESLILEGAANILENVRPVISVEVGEGKEWQKNNQDSIKLLQARDYIGYEIDKNGLISPSTPKDLYILDNLIFVPREKISQIKDLIKN